MKTWLQKLSTASILLVLLIGFSHARAEKPVLVDYGVAPGFAGIEKWLNSEPLTMEGLRGKVVLLDFWTYSCINCLRTLPHVTKWHERYKDQGLVVVGVHTPEFAFERQTRNVQTAIKRFGIKYPVAQDNQYATWKAYDNQYWPAAYLIDRKGRIVLKHFGEGRYDEMESAIRMLLASDAPPEAAELPLPFQGGGWEGDGFQCSSSSTKTHPHPNPPLEREGTKATLLRAKPYDRSKGQTLLNTSAGKAGGLPH